MDPLDEAVGRLAAQRHQDQTRAEDRAWADEQAHELVRRYVRSLKGGGVRPLRVIAPTFTRQDWTERVGGLLSRQKVARHRWVRQDGPAGTAWLVRPADTVATVKRGVFRYGESAPDTVTPVVVLYDEVRDELRLAVLLGVEGYQNSLSRQGENFDQVRGAREATVAPRIVGERCAETPACQGCGYPLWAERLDGDAFTHLGVRGSWYEDLPHGGFQEHAAPAGRGLDALDHYVGPLLATLDDQLHRQHLSWED